MTSTPTPPPSAEDLRRRLDLASSSTVGLEEEVMLLEPDSLDLAPRAGELHARLPQDGRFKLELPASQLEIATFPGATAEAAAGALAAGRTELLRAAGNERVRLAGSGTHPFAAVEGVLNDGTRYRQLQERYGAIARQQLVHGLHVHVLVPGADRALAVYNALRSYLPELAALAANSPFRGGVDTGLTAVRPLVSGMLPRQGIPPAFASWEEYAAALQWGIRTGTASEPRQWWWELRPHPHFGTLEIRVPDTQITPADTAGVAAAAQALVAWLMGRHDAGESLPVVPSWQIAENRWSAARRGLDAPLANLEGGAGQSARERWESLLAEIESTVPAAARGSLERVRPLLVANGAERQRAVARERGLVGLTAWLAQQFAARDSAG